MRKMLAAVALLVLEWLASLAIDAVIDMSEFPALLSPPWLFVLLGVNAMTVFSLHVPEIRRGLRWFSTGERVVREERKAQNRHKQELRARRVAHFDGLARVVRVQTIKCDPQSRTLTLSLGPRRTWKQRLIRASVWLANRRWWVNWPATERVVSWIAQRLGARPSQYDESSEKVPESRDTPDAVG